MSLVIQVVERFLAFNLAIAQNVALLQFHIFVVYSSDMFS